MKKRFVDKSADVQHFSLRKLSIGVASVLIGTTFMMYGGRTVHAAEENPDSNSSSSDDNTSESVNTKENTAVLKNNYTTQSQVESDQSNSGSNSANDVDKSADSKVLEDNKTDNLEANKVQDNKTENIDTAKSDVQVNKDSSTDLEEKSSNPSVSANQVNKANQQDSQNNQENASNTDNGITNHGVDPSQIAALKNAALKAMGMDRDLTDAQLAQLGIDRDTFIHNGIKYRVKADISVYLGQDPSKYFTWDQDPRHDANGDAHNSSVDIGENDNTAAAMDAGIGRIVFNQLWAPLVNGGTIYINRGSKLSDTDALRGVSNSKFAGGFESVVWDNQIANQVDVNKVGTYNAAVDVTYKNKLGVSAGVKVIVIDPQGKTVYVTKGDSVDSAEDDLITSSVPTGSANTAVWEISPSTQNVGTQTGTILVTYPDGSHGEAEVTYIVSDPQGQDLVVVPGYQPKPGELISNSNSMPAGTTYSWTTTAPDTRVPGSVVPSEVTVTYPDGHSHDVLAGVRVISAAGKPAITVHVNDPVPDAKTIITNTSDLPSNTTYTWKTEPSTSTAGTFPATVEVTYPTGVVQEVPTNVIVIGNNNNNPATVTVKDHSKEVIRVIVDNVPGSQPIVTWQTVHYSRDVTYDTKTGTATKYGDWQADNTPIWAAYTAHGAAGYTPDITVVPAQNVTPDTQNTVVSIIYTLNSQPTSPTSPSNPTSPTIPTTPTSPINPTTPSNPSSPTSPSNPTTPVNPTSPSNPTSPTSPSNPTNPAQPTTAPVHPETPPTSPTTPNQSNNNGGNSGNNGNNSNPTNNSGNNGGNVAPHATVTARNGNNGSGTNSNVAPGNGTAVNNIHKQGSGSGNVAPHAQSLANNGNGVNSSNLPKSSSNSKQNQLPQTGQSAKEEAMAAAGLMIAVGDGIFVMAGAQKRRRRN